MTTANDAIVGHLAARFTALECNPFNVRGIVSVVWQLLCMRLRRAAVDTRPQQQIVCHRYQNRAPGCGDPATDIGDDWIIGAVNLDHPDRMLRNAMLQRLLAQFAPTLAKHPLLIVTSNDGGAAGNERVAAAVKAQPGAKVSVVHLATDHSYNDQRVALASIVVGWLNQAKQVK